MMFQLLLLPLPNFLVQHVSTFVFQLTTLYGPSVGSWWCHHQFFQFGRPDTTNAERGSWWVGGLCQVHKDHALDFYLLSCASYLCLSHKVVVSLLVVGPAQTTDTIYIHVPLVEKCYFGSTLFTLGFTAMEIEKLLHTSSLLQSYNFSMTFLLGCIFGHISE